MSFRPQTPLAAIRWLTIENGSGETIPGFAVAAVLSVDDDGVITVGKPSQDSQLNVIINGPTPIEHGDRGMGTRDSPAWVLYDDAVTPAAGDGWGTVADSWEIASGKAGFIIAGGADGSRVLVFFNLCLAAEEDEPAAPDNPFACGACELPELLTATYTESVVCQCLVDIDFTLVTGLGGNCIGYCYNEEVLGCVTEPAAVFIDFECYETGFYRLLLNEGSDRVIIDSQGPCGYIQDYTCDPYYLVISTPAFTMVIAEPP